MDLGFRGKTFVLTGAGGGLGRATTQLLADEGANLILTDQSASELESVAGELGGTHATVPADLTSERGIASVIERADAEGGADGLVHAAGITGAKGDPLEVGDDDFMACWQTNFMSAVRLMRGLVPGMVERGWGRVVVIVSENAIQPYADEAVYNVS
ncbi:MAG: SDR family oxidoreductase, partial [Pseudomonadota bacterium]